MTAAAVILYMVGATFELAGVGLVVADFRAQRQAWAAYVTDPLAGTVKGLLDRAAPQTNTTWGQIERTTTAIESLLRANPRRRALTVGLLVAGIVVGTAANVISAVK